jgi:hypothetical protein
MQRKQTTPPLLTTRRPHNFIHGIARFANFNNGRDIPPHFWRPGQLRYPFCCFVADPSR